MPLWIHFHFLWRISARTFNAVNDLQRETRMQLSNVVQ